MADQVARPGEVLICNPVLSNHTLRKELCLFFFVAVTPEERLNSSQDPLAMKVLQPGELLLLPD